MNHRIIFLFALISFLALMGCSAILPPTPTPTPLPTATPTITPTPPPTATRPKPTATKENALPPAIAFALNKTQDALSMTYDFESSVTTVQNGQTKKIPGLALKGSDSTLNRDVVLSGTTSDTNEFISYQVIVLGEQIFLKGLGGDGLDPQQWYLLPEQMQAGVRRLPTARGLIASFDPADVAKAQFQAAGNETLDELNCSVWAAQNKQFAQTLVGVTQDSELGKQVGEIDDAEFKIWTCADGYIHLLAGSVQGHAASSPQNKTTVTLRFAMNDFDRPVKIIAPTDTKPFPATRPQTTPVTATPAATKPAATPTP